VSYGLFSTHRPVFPDAERVCGCVSVFSSQDIKLLSYANQRLFCRPFFCAAATRQPTVAIRGKERENGGKGTETDSWSAPNLSQWYADKTNKYQRFFFIPFAPFFPALSAPLHFSKKSWETTLANKFKIFQWKIIIKSSKIVCLFNYWMFLIFRLAHLVIK